MVIVSCQGRQHLQRAAGPAGRRRGHLARTAVSPWRHARAGRHQFRGRFAAGRARRAVPDRRGRPRDKTGAARTRRRHLARVRARNRRRPAIRLPGDRALRPGARIAVQPGEAAPRPVRQGDRRCGGVGRCPARVPARQPGRPERPGLRAVDAPVAGGRSLVCVGPGPAAGHSLPRHDHLRAAREGVHSDAR